MKIRDNIYYFCMGLGIAIQSFLLGMDTQSNLVRETLLQAIKDRDANTVLCLVHNPLVTQDDLTRGFNLAMGIRAHHIAVILEKHGAIVTDKDKFANAQALLRANAYRLKQYSEKNNNQ
jgi:hypothetical protein